MISPVSQINFDKLVVKKPNAIGSDGKSIDAPFGQDIPGAEMRFCQIVDPIRPPMFIMNATVSECVDLEHGPVMVVRPETADLVNLEKLESLFQPFSANYEKVLRSTGWTDGLESYEQRGTLTNDFKLKFKLTLVTPK